MLRALRSMPNSSGGTPATRAPELRLRVTTVTSWSCGAGASGKSGCIRGHILWLAHRLGRRTGVRFFGICARAMCDHLDLGIRDDDRELLVGQIVVGLPLFALLLLLPPHLHDADFRQ